MKLAFLIIIFLSSGVVATEVDLTVDADKEPAIKQREIENPRIAIHQLREKMQARLAAVRLEQKKQAELAAHSLKEEQQAALDAQRLKKQATLTAKSAEAKKPKKQKLSVEEENNCLSVGKLLVDWDAAIAESFSPKAISEKRNDAYKRGHFNHNSGRGGSIAVSKFDAQQERLEEEYLVKRMKIQQKIVNLGC
jgi:hypothetical protein